MTERVKFGRGLIACPSCDALHRRPDESLTGDGHCVACGHKLFTRIPNSIQRTLALSLSGLVFFLPANIFPLVTLSSYGVHNQNELASGPIELLSSRMPAVSLLVFLTSIVFPILLLLCLGYVSACGQLDRFPDRSFTQVMRLLKKLYRWAMIDVYILACLVAFVKLADLAKVDPGTGLYCLAGVLACTVLASLSYDPDLLWSRYVTASERRRA
ncbi:paraquat-inducible protein A [Cerasicoccus arenae]|uniref:Paraquat-inducible protein A n=1 Tax=Cerasicoccus arenae TaxID=424488 RepID=A0A8J3D9J5_9BACT|nr:paraquat-inducible protein A [Cerasicoccus arenae]MBK1859115.1 paraquat-inducible protein A [Cerasicoccus arenae]GHB91861.1 hypothetical protein GCM10007047_03460 [Cerasicoccus arenae]